MNIKTLDTNQNIGDLDFFYQLYYRIGNKDSIFWLEEHEIQKVDYEKIDTNFEKFSDPYKCLLYNGNRIRKGTNSIKLVTSDQKSDVYTLDVCEKYLTVIKYKYNHIEEHYFFYDLKKSFNEIYTLKPFIFSSMDDLEQYVGELFLSVKKYEEINFKKMANLTN